MDRTSLLRILAVKSGLLLLLPMWLPAHALAQTATTGAIAGAARDTTGAVLPGVTVEAASPALIEKVRTAITDAQGNYKITDLRPGTYAVTFTLTGFSTVKREGLDLTAGVTITVHGDMKVGSVAETITVTGETPVVDTQNSRSQALLRADTLEALPAGSKSVMNFASLTLGAMPSSAGGHDVGGDRGETATGITIHGSRGDDGRVNLDGMNINNFNGAGGGRMRVYYPNVAAVQEVVIDTGGNTTESEVGGANQNLVPRDGSNNFTFHGMTNWTNDKLSAKSISSDAAARGAIPFSSVQVIFDHALGVGGPIKRDAMWFYATNRWWGARSPALNDWFNKSTDFRYYVPDLSRPAYQDQFYRDMSGRVTWQVSSKDKISLEEHRQDGCSCWLRVGASAPEATTDFLYRGLYLTQVTWSRTASNKLLIQASANFLKQSVSFTGMSALNKNSFTFATPLPDVPNAIRVTEQIGFTTPFGNRIPAGFSYNALGPGSNNYGPGNPNDNYNQRVSLSYVTGSHAFKVGLQTLEGIQDTIGVPAATANSILGRSLSYTFRAGQPVSLTQALSPLETDVRIRSLGLFAQDQWTLGQLTLNYGVRYDQFVGRAPAVTLARGPFVTPVTLPEVNDIPNFKDISVRLGAAYDLFGNGRTAVKGSFGRYLLGQGAGLTVSAAPTPVSSVTRSWNDQSFAPGDPRNGNFIPNCDLTNLDANGECGRASNLAFGQLAVPNAVLADEARAGWGVRQYNYQTSVQLQHELRPGVSVAVGYFRTWWGNHTVTVNTLVQPSDFTPYCIPAPTDSRLGDVSGQQICGLYDVKPGKLGQVQNVIHLAKNLGFGTPKEIYNGVDLSMNARWGRGAFVSGGLSIGQQTIDNCFANNHPELSFSVSPGSTANYPRDPFHCQITAPVWNGGTQLKAQAAYPLPLDFQVSGVFKTVPGIPQSATVTLSDTQVKPYLGRDLSSCPATGACTSTVAIQMLASGQAGDDGASAAKLFDQRLTELDLRLTKSFRFGPGRRVLGIVDLYNVFNNRPAQAFNGSYVLPNGGSWQQITSLLTGRLLKFGAQVDW